MLNRYQVVFSKWSGRNGNWTPIVRGSFKSPRAAERLAQHIGDRHPDLRRTKWESRRNRSGVEVVDAKRNGKTLWEHPGVIVPSVGELGYW
jgi:hypothetical protein